MKFRFRVTLPNAAKRFLSVIGLRTLVNPSDPADIRRINELQDTINVSQMGPGRLETPYRDRESLLKVSRDN